MAKRQRKRAKDALWEEMNPMSKLEDFLKRLLNPILAMTRIFGVNVCLY
jgi:hypothetical protein